MASTSKQNSTQIKGNAKLKACRMKASKLNFDIYDSQANEFIEEIRPMLDEADMSDECSCCWVLY